MSRFKLPTAEPGAPSTQFVIRINCLPYKMPYGYDERALHHDLREEIMKVCPSTRFECKIEVEKQVQSDWVTALISFANAKEGFMLFNLAHEGNFRVSGCRAGVEIPQVIAPASQQSSESANSSPNSSAQNDASNKRALPAPKPTSRQIDLPKYIPFYFTEMPEIRKEIESTFGVTLSTKKKVADKLRINAPSQSVYKRVCKHIMEKSKELVVEPWTSNIMRDTKMHRNCVKMGIWIETIFHNLARKDRDVLVIPRAVYSKFESNYKRPPLDLYFPVAKFVHSELVTQGAVRDILQKHKLPHKETTALFNHLPARGIRLSGKEGQVLAACHDLEVATSKALQLQRTFTFDLEPSVTQKVVNHIAQSQSQFSSTQLLLPPSETLLLKTTQKKKVALSTKKVVEIRLGSILDVKADAYVNSAAQEMHNSGGIARIIENASTPKMTDEVSFLKQLKKDQLVVGGAVHTVSAPTNALYVIHAFPPRRTDVNAIALMKKCVFNTFKVAHELRIETLAIPLLGAGIFGWKAKEAAEVIVPEALKRLANHPCVKKLVFVDTNADCTAHIEETLTQLTTTQQSKVVAPPQPQKIASSNQAEKQWYWRNENDQWEGYSSDLCKVISNAHRSGTTCVVKMNGREYIIDPSAGKQTNKQTGHHRRVTSKISEESHDQWFWLDGDQGWKPYSANDNMKICTAFAKNEPQVELQALFRHVDDKQCDYIVDLSQMQQFNCKTGYKRQVKRETTSQKAAVVNARSSSSHQKIVDAQVIREDSFDTCIRYICFSDKDAAVVRKLLVEIAKLYVHEQKTPFMQYVDYDTTCKKYGIGYKRVQDLVVLRGDKTVVMIVADLLQQSNQTQVKFPTTWTPMVHNEWMEVIAATDAEIKMVMQKFHLTTPNGKVEKVERIQNVNLWNKYDSHRRVLQQSKGKILPEMHLFHGTRNTDPKVVYSSPKGFDRGYSRETCLFGDGFYFAVNSSYSVRYRSTTQDGKYQMLVCRVLVGEHADGVSQGQHKAPPAGKDSIKAHLEGSDVYVVYHSECVYPEYLITFTV